MPFMTLYIYSTVRVGGTEILACSAADTTFGIYYGDLHRTVITGFGVNHGYRSCGTMVCAVATLYSVGKRYTVIFHPDCMADLC